MNLLSRNDRLDSHDITISDTNTCTDVTFLILSHLQTVQCSDIEHCEINFVELTKTCVCIQLLLYEIINEIFNYQLLGYFCVYIYL